MINTVDVVEDLLTEIGPDLDVQGVLSLEEGLWVVVYDEKTIVVVRHDPDRKCLNFTIDLGNVPPGNELTAYRHLLAYSSLTERTGGIRIVLDSPQGGLVQMLDLFTEDLDHPTLETVIGNFVSTARAWRTVIARGLSIDDTDETPAAHIEELEPDTALRV